VKRTRFPRRAKHLPDVDALVRLAQALGRSSSHIEDGYWETRLNLLVDGHLKSGSDESLNTALDQLYGSGERGYDRLADLIEARCEGRSDECDLVMFAAPILAWSRFTIPAGSVSAEVLANARVHLLAHVLADGARVGLSDFLFGPDQLPQGYGETAALRDKLAKAALHSRDQHFDPAQMPETVGFLSDTRYLLGVVAVPRGGAMFRWQESDDDRETILKHWRAQGGEALRPALPACAIEALLPLPFFSACREADRISRPYSVRAGVAFLNTSFNIEPHQLRAIVAPFFEKQLEEYRIGITLADSSEVIHGVVWPLLETEDESTDIPAQIEAILREAGLIQVLFLDQHFPLEFCEDCGTPLYPNPEGEPVHAEIPEEQATSAPQHLH
jgi:hypothetical protein